MSIDEIIKQTVEREVRREVETQLSPLRILNVFEDKTVLSVEDMCLLFGKKSDKNGREAIRNACRRGELPYRKFGQEFVFPRPMVEAWLFGEWKPKEVEVKANIRMLADKVR